MITVISSFNNSTTPTTSEDLRSEEIPKQEEKGSTISNFAHFFRHDETVSKVAKVAFVLSILLPPLGVFILLIEAIILAVQHFSSKKESESPVIGAEGQVPKGLSPEEQKAAKAETAKSLFESFEQSEGVVDISTETGSFFNSKAAFMDVTGPVSADISHPAKYPLDPQFKNMLKDEGFPYTLQISPGAVQKVRPKNVDFITTTKNNKAVAQERQNVNRLYEFLRAIKQSPRLSDKGKEKLFEAVMGAENPLEAVQTFQNTLLTSIENKVTALDVKSPTFDNDIKSIKQELRDYGISNSKIDQLHTQFTNFEAGEINEDELLRNIRGQLLFVTGLSVQVEQCCENYNPESNRGEETVKLLTHLMGGKEGKIPAFSNNEPFAIAQVVLARYVSEPNLGENEKKLLQDAGLSVNIRTNKVNVLPATQSEAADGSSDAIFTAFNTTYAITSEKIVEFKDEGGKLVSSFKVNERYDIVHNPNAPEEPCKVTVTRGVEKIQSPA